MKLMLTNVLPIPVEMEVCTSLFSFSQCCLLSEIFLWIPRIRVLIDLISPKYSKYYIYIIILYHTRINDEDLAYSSIAKPHTISVPRHP